MARIILQNKEYILNDFNREDELEKAVIENKRYIFGKDSVYIDVKKRIGKENHKSIPDAFLIDFYDSKKPQLYIVENEIASHDVYSHIAEQIARFATSVISSGIQVRQMLLEEISKNPDLTKEIKNQLNNTDFKTITDLLLYLVEQNIIKIVIVINENSEDLNLVLKIFKNQPDVVILQRYICAGDILYYYEPMREEIEDIEIEKAKTGNAVEFDTVVCAAFEDGFNRAYIESKAWWAIRLSQEAREKLKYLAIYEKAPKAEISNYAEIDRIEPYKDTGKYILYLKNQKKIPPIKLNVGKGEAPQSPRYTTLKKLLSAKFINELWG